MKGLGPAPPSGARRGRLPGRSSPADWFVPRPRGQDRKSPSPWRHRRRSTGSAVGLGPAVRRETWSAFSPSSDLEMEIADAAEHRGVVFGRHVGDAGYPGQQIGLDRIEQMLVLVEFRVAERPDMHVGKAAHDEVRLAGAAMPGPEQQPPPSRVATAARSGTPGHEFSNAKNPAGAVCEIYIERAARNVSRAEHEQEVCFCARSTRSLNNLSTTPALPRSSGAKPWTSRCLVLHRAASLNSIHALPPRSRLNWKCVPQKNAHPSTARDRPPSPNFSFKITPQ